VIGFYHRTPEECLPREYKRKYTKTESQQNHLSGVQQPELVVSIKGDQISQSDTDSKVPDSKVPGLASTLKPTKVDLMMKKKIKLRTLNRKKNQRVCFHSMMNQHLRAAKGEGTVFDLVRFPKQ
jgi:hypothetical protein